MIDGFIFFRDEYGNAGKSIFAEFLEYKGMAFEMPLLQSMEDLMQFANSFPPKRAYMIDMPRAISKQYAFLIRNFSALRAVSKQYAFLIPLTQLMHNRYKYHMPT